MTPTDYLTLARALRNAITSEEAFGLIVDAIDNGLGWREAAECWREWRELTESSVKQIGGAA